MVSLYHNSLRICMRDKGTVKTRKTNRVFRFFAFSYKNFARSDSFPSHPSNELRTEVLHPADEAAQKAGKTTACKTGRTLFVRFRSVCIHRSDGGLAMGNEDKRKFRRPTWERRNKGIRRPRPYAEAVALSSLRITEKMNRADRRHSTISTLHTIHRAMPLPHRYPISEVA